MVYRIEYIENIQRFRMFMTVLLIVMLEHVYFVHDLVYFYKAIKFLKSKLLHICNSDHKLHYLELHII